MADPRERDASSRSRELRPPRIQRRGTGTDWKCLPQTWEKLRQGYVEFEGVSLSAGDVKLLMGYIIAMEESLRDAQVESARVRNAFGHGGRDAAMRALGLTDPSNKGKRSRVKWSWDQAAEWFQNAVDGKGQLRLPDDPAALDVAMIEAHENSPRRADPWLRKTLEFDALVNSDLNRIKQLGGHRAIQRPANPIFAVRVVALIMGVEPRRARTELRPALREKGLEHLLPPERVFKKGRQERPSSMT